jgi:hypothetical protein
MLPLAGVKYTPAGTPGRRRQRGRDRRYIPLYPDNQNEISAAIGSEISDGNAAIRAIDHARAQIALRAENF